MKKTVIIEILLVFVFCVLLANSIKTFVGVNILIQSINQLSTMDVDGLTKQDMLIQIKQSISTGLSYAIPALLAAFATIAAMVLVAFRDIPALRDRLAARKSRRTAEKAEQAAIAKQERMNKLQAELDELKKED